MFRYDIFSSNSPFPSHISIFIFKENSMSKWSKGKGKGHPRKGHEGSEGE
jgi:hypothetical protein